MFMILIEGPEADLSITFFNENELTLCDCTSSYTYHKYYCSYYCTCIYALGNTIIMIIVNNTVTFQSGYYRGIKLHIYISPNRSIPLGLH